MGNKLPSAALTDGLRHRLRTLDRGWLRLFDHLNASYTSAKECISEINSREQRLRNDRSLFTARSAPTSLTVTETQASFTTTYRCLPDTVDPRGAKGN